MNDPIGEFQKVLAGVFANVAVVCFTVPVVERILRGTDVSQIDPRLMFLGVICALVLIGFSAVVLFCRNW